MIFFVFFLVTGTDKNFCHTNAIMSPTYWLDSLSIFYVFIKLGNKLFKFFNLKYVPCFIQFKQNYNWHNKRNPFVKRTWNATFYTVFVQTNLHVSLSRKDCSRLKVYPSMETLSQILFIIIYFCLCHFTPPCLDEWIAEREQELTLSQLYAGSPH